MYFTNQSGPCLERRTVFRDEMEARPDWLRDYESREQRKKGSLELQFTERLDRSRNSIGIRTSLQCNPLMPWCLGRCDLTESMRCELENRE